MASCIFHTHLAPLTHFSGTSCITSNQTSILSHCSDNSRKKFSLREELTGVQNFKVFQSIMVGKAQQLELANTSVQAVRQQQPIWKQRQDTTWSQPSKAALSNSHLLTRGLQILTTTPLPGNQVFKYTYLGGKIRF